MTNRSQTEPNQPLIWTGRVFSADDVRRHLTGQRELIVPTSTILTPLAWDDLRAKGVRVTRQDARPAAEKSTKTTWAYAQEKADPVVKSAVLALAREGLSFRDWTIPAATGWAKALSEIPGGVVFCTDPALLCCVANKAQGVRAAMVLTAAGAAKALVTLGANLIAVEMPGRTFFEVRQILKTVGGATPSCPRELANTLKELETHANR